MCHTPGSQLSVSCKEANPLAGPVSGNGFHVQELLDR